MKEKNNETVTYSMILDREMYNQFKSIVVKEGGTVKDSIIEYMKTVIKYEGDKDGE